MPLSSLLRARFNRWCSTASAAPQQGFRTPHAGSSCKFITAQGLKAQHFQAIISSGAIPLLSQLLSRGKTQGSREAAAQLLWLLQGQVPGSALPALVASKAAKPLTQMLASLDAHVLGPAAGLLHTLLTTYPTETRPLAAKAGTVRHLVVLLTTIDLGVKQAVYCCIGDIARDKQCSRALVAAGAVPKLVAAVADAAAPPWLLWAAAGALRSMALSGMQAL
jgi:hypothetical protein